MLKMSLVPTAQARLNVPAETAVGIKKQSRLGVTVTMGKQLILDLQLTMSLAIAKVNY